MTSIERNVKRTQWRVGVNDWFMVAGWCLLAAAGLWVLADLSDKLFGLDLPRLTILSGLVGLAAVASVVWAWFLRKDPLTAATILDKAAGLKERTSSGLCCARMEDPFAQAVVQDAEHISRSITPQLFIRLRWPSSLSMASAAVLLAVIVTLLPIGPLHASERPEPDAQRSDDVQRAEVQRVQRQLQSIQEKAEKNPALNELKTQLKTIDELPPEKLPSPQSVRREAIKKIDSLADAVKKEQGDREEAMKEIKRMFRGMKATQPPETPAEKLSQSLAKGDFRSAKQAVDEMREQLAKMAQQEDPAKQKELQEQLQNLAKKLEQVSREEDRKQELKKELEKAGVDPKTLERALEHLTKEDIAQVKEQMKKSGAPQQQINEMMKKMAAQQACTKEGSDLAGAMQKAAQAVQNSSASEAAQQLDEAADQLNSMEMMDQQLGEMQSTIADLQDMKNDLSANNPGQCSACSGRGCSRCSGGDPGQGMGGGMNPGQGRGGRSSEEVTNTGFQKERTPVHTTSGAIIAKMFVDGEQVRGDVATEAVELLTAAERDATDAINKNKVPNYYRGPIKKYFSGMLEDFENAASKDSSDGGASPSGASEGSASDDGE